MDENLNEWDRITRRLYDLDKEQTRDAMFFFVGFLQSRMATRIITSKDVCDALRESMRDMNPE